MNNSEIVLSNNANSLVKVGNIISLTNKLLKVSSSKSLQLFDPSEYSHQIKSEQLLISFIKGNFWYFIKQLIDKVNNNDFNHNTIPSKIISLIENDKLNYEYPRCFFRRRGTGVKNSSIKEQQDYDDKIIIENKLFTEISTPLDKNLQTEILKSVNQHIAGAVLADIAATSIGILHGIKLNWHHKKTGIK